MRNDAPEPDYQPQPAGADPRRAPDEHELAIERDLLQKPGVQAATIVGDEWLVYLRRGSDLQVLPERIDDRLVRVELVG